jgi:hypothetical protein
MPNFITFWLHSYRLMLGLYPSVQTGIGGQWSLNTAGFEKQLKGAFAVVCARDMSITNSSQAYYAVSSVLT